MDDNNQKDERPISTLKGLLKFCMDATKSEDAPCESAHDEAMAPERKEWLEEALNSMTVDTVKRLSDCLKTIEDAVVDTEEGTKQIIDALTELEDWVEDLDIAQDFITIKGLRVIPLMLNSEVSEIRWRCLELLANLCQNNPKVQSAVVHAHYLAPILLLVDQDANPTVRVKALYALSCLIRSNIPVQTMFIANDGLDVLVHALQSEEEKLRIKASFLLFAISRDNHGLKDSLLDKNLAEQLIVALKKKHCLSHEHLMAAFVSLVDKHSRFKEFCLQDKFELKSFLVKRIKTLEGKEEFQDEKSHADEFLNTLYSSSDCQPTQSSPTRALMLAS